MSISLVASLQGVIDVLEQRVMPEIEDRYLSETIRMARSVLTIAVNAADDAVALRLEENAALRTLFADAAGAVAGELGDRLAERGRSSDSGFKISELDRDNAELRALLVELHAEVELRADVPGLSLNKRIWGILKAIEARRAPVG